MGPGEGSDRRSGLPGRRGAPGEEAVVFEAGLAVGERLAVKTEDMAAGGFQHRLAGAGVPFHRRPEARIEIRVSRGQDAEFERAAADLPFKDRLVLKIFGEAAAVFVTAAVDEDDSLRARGAAQDRLAIGAV